MVGDRRRLGRRRGRARVVLRVGLPLVVATVVVVLATSALSQIGSQSGPYRLSVDRGYAALATPLVDTSNAGGASLRSFLRTARTLDRVTFFSELDTLAADSHALRRRFDAIAPPDPATSAAAACRAALASRARAVDALRAAFEGVVGGRRGLDPVGEPAALAGAEGAVGTLHGADGSWASCRRGLARAPGGASLPASVWTSPASLFSATALSRLVSGIAAARPLVPLHRLAIVAIVTDPPAVPQGATRVAPPVTGLVAQVVLTNQGNVDEGGVEVGGVAFVQDQPASPVPVQHTVDLAAGASATLKLPAFAVRPGDTYVVQVTAESPRDSGVAPIASRTTVVEVQPATTLTAVTASPATVPAGGSVTFTAEVTTGLAGVGSPPGTVDFQDDGATISGCGARPVRSGTATCQTTLPAGTSHSVAAVYSGNAHFEGSSAPGITVKVLGR
ncbi:MAG TPA: Ig-like domain-containing protein [Acidimicrobiales bacterium]|nr:Ig-like domain-containing protein [Acidimicrobiales bacterium]